MATLYQPHFRRLGLLLALCASAQAAVSAQRDRYQAIEIGALGGVLSYANSVNDLGVVVGNVQYADGHVQAFRWMAATGIHRIQTGVRESMATCVNDLGQISGATRDSNNIVNAIVWNSRLNPTIIAEAPFGAIATSINDKGTAVGYREDGIFTVTDEAFLWPAVDPNSEWTNLFDQGSDSFATAINDQGEIVGSVNRQAFVRSPNGTVTILAGSPDSGPSAMAVAINDKGQVLVSLGSQGLILTRNTRTLIQAPVAITPASLNLGGEVVGFTQTSSPRGFLWDQKNGYASLDDLIVTPGWHIFSGNSVNRYGEIAGFGIHNGRKRAVLLVPVKV